MIRTVTLLARDAMRLLVRPRAIASVAIVALLFGAFVRATQHSAASELAGIDVRGSSLQSLMSGVFLFATCIGLVFGVLLGHDDRETGFIAQLAIRPVSRLEYALGRGLGLVAASLVAALLLVAVAFAVADVGADGFQDLRTIERAQGVAVGDRVLAEGDVSSIDRGSIARFEFPPRPHLSCRFSIEPLPRLGEFTGKTHFVLRVMAGGEPVAHVELDGRDTGPLSCEFPGPYPDAGIVEIENLTVGAALRIASDQLVLTGGRASILGQFSLALGTLLAAASIVATLAFCFATALSAGLAALTAGFVLLISLARDSVLDLVADALSSRSPAVRDWFRGAVRIAPDLGRFDLSDPFSRGEALRLGEAAHLAGLGALYVAVALVLTALVLSWRDRR